MNKILISLVLIFGLSGNAYSVMIDVRTDEEWRAGYKKALFIFPYPRLKKISKIMQFLKMKKFYCIAEAVIDQVEQK